MRPIHHHVHAFVRSRPHLSVAIAGGVLLAFLLPDTLPPVRRALIAWNGAVWPYLLSISWLMMRSRHHTVKLIAEKQDESGPMVLVTLSIAAIASLTAIVYELSSAVPATPNALALRYTFTALTVFASWFLVGVLFTFHYAHMYYRARPEARPLLFPCQECAPDYWDFMYFAFTIAVAAQTSDVLVQSRLMRKVVLGQSLLSFFFNLAILGLSINIAAGLINH
ncbi:MAG: DUF1345 domain-containing protein [Pseudomonadota bacterium]